MCTAVYVISLRGSYKRVVKIQFRINSISIFINVVLLYRRCRSLAREEYPYVLKENKQIEIKKAKRKYGGMLNGKNQTKFNIIKRSFSRVFFSQTLTLIGNTRTTDLSYRRDSQSLY